MSGSSHRNALDRVVLSLAEQRIDLGFLPAQQLGELAGYSAQTIRNVETGRIRNPATVTRLRLALLVYELYGQPRLLEEDLGALLHIEREEVAV